MNLDQIILMLGRWTKIYKRDYRARKMIYKLFYIYTVHPDWTSPKQLVEIVNALNSLPTEFL
jgi:hypothetical protein